MSSAFQPEALLADVALGSRQAFERLYRDTADRLFAICLRVLTDRGEAEEALQEAFTSVWRPARARFEEIDLASELPDPGPSPAQRAETQIAQRALERCIETLEPRRRSLIRAAFFDGFTYEELAARVSEPLGSVKSWIRRGLMQLRACLEA